MRGQFKLDGDTRYCGFALLEALSYLQQLSGHTCSRVVLGVVNISFVFLSTSRCIYQGFAGTSHFVALHRGSPLKCLFALLAYVIAACLHSSICSTSGFASRCSRSVRAGPRVAISAVHAHGPMATGEPQDGKRAVGSAGCQSLRVRRMPVVAMPVVAGGCQSLRGRHHDAA